MARSFLVPWTSRVRRGPFARLVCVMSSDPTKGDVAAKAAVRSAQGRVLVRKGALPGLLALILTVLIQSGCVGLTGADSSAAAAAAAGLSITPSSVSFGNVGTGTSSSRNVTIANSGGSNVTVVNVSVSGAGFNVSGVPAGLILAPGQSAGLAVRFAPASTGNVTGQATLTVDAVNTPLSITLSGTGVRPSSHSVTLSWNASTSSLAGYRTYRATASGGPYTSLNSSLNPATQFTDSNVSGGRTYYYVVTAVDSNTVESVYSNQATATVPAP